MLTNFLRIVQKYERKFGVMKKLVIWFAMLALGSYGSVNASEFNPKISREFQPYDPERAYFCPAESLVWSGDAITEKDATELDEMHVDLKLLFTINNQVVLPSLEEDSIGLEFVDIVTETADVLLLSVNTDDWGEVEFPASVKMKLIKGLQKNNLVMLGQVGEYDLIFFYTCKLSKHPG